MVGCAFRLSGDGMRYEEWRQKAWIFHQIFFLEALNAIAGSGVRADLLI